MHGVVYKGRWSNQRDRDDVVQCDMLYILRTSEESDQRSNSRVDLFWSAQVEIASGDCDYDCRIPA